jgi:DNA-directed RNA polymerase specialized sigma24 family protein
MSMSTSPDSSRPRLADIPELPDEERRTRLLTSDRLRSSIRKVARGHHVPDVDVDDIVQETLAQAWKAKLPDSDAEVSKYVHRIAANVACRHKGKTLALEPYIENPDEGSGEVATPIAVQPASFETRDVVSKLVAKGEQRFPRGFPSFLEAKATEATAEQAAMRRGVSPGHVRREWSEIQHFLGQHGRSMGLAMAFACIVLVIGNIAHWGQQPLVSHPFPGDTPPLDAAALRSRAKAECAARTWRACVADLDAADKIDPAGETSELRALRLLAKKHIATPEGTEWRP